MGEMKMVRRFNIIQQHRWGYDDIADDYHEFNSSGFGSDRFACDENYR